MRVVLEENDGHKLRASGEYLCRRFLDVPTESYRILGIMAARCNASCGCVVVKRPDHDPANQFAEAKNWNLLPGFNDM